MLRPKWVAENDFLRRKFHTPARDSSRTKSQHGSRKVAKRVAQSRNMGCIKSQHESRKVATGVAQSRNMCRAELQNGSGKVATWVSESQNGSFKVEK